MVSIENRNFAKNKIAVELKFLVLQNITNVIGTSKCLDPLTPITLIYDSVTLPIMCKGIYRKSSRKIACVNTALNDNLISSIIHVLANPMLGCALIFCTLV